MGKIATEQEAYNIGGTGSYTTNKCCTYTRAVNTFNCAVSGSYSTNQLVQLSDLSKATTYYTLTITSSTYSGIALMSALSYRISTVTDYQMYRLTYTRTYEEDSTSVLYVNNSSATSASALTQIAKGVGDTVYVYGVYNYGTTSAYFGNSTSYIIRNYDQTITV